MSETIPIAVRGLLAAKGKRDDAERRAERARARAEARKRAQVRRHATSLACRALRWSRTVAASGDLPASGVEIFACGDRARTTVDLMPGGKLVFHHSFPPYFGARVTGRRARDLATVPVDVLQGVVEAIESGAVWKHAEDVMRRESLLRRPRTRLPVAPAARRRLR